MKKGSPSGPDSESWSGERAPVWAPPMLADAPRARCAVPISGLDLSFCSCTFSRPAMAARSRYARGDHAPECCFRGLRLRRIDLPVLASQGLLAPSHLAVDSEPRGSV